MREHDLETCECQGCGGDVPVLEAVLLPEFPDRPNPDAKQYCCVSCFEFIEKQKKLPDELTALHALAKSCPGGVEGCEWWPECVYADIRTQNLWEAPAVYMNGYVQELRDSTARRLVSTATHRRWRMVSAGHDVPIDPQHALDLVERHAERWLDSLEWKMYRSNGVVKYCPPITGQYYSLHDALKYAMTHPQTKGKPC